MKIFLAGTYSRPYVFKTLGLPIEEMKLYLAGEPTVKNGRLANWHGLYILESFVYARENKRFLALVQSGQLNLLLDSGAFTFMNDKKNQAGANWDEYILQYCEFIKDHNIGTFFELDIDNVVGLPRVEHLRKKTEQLTGRQCIPVWHRARGLDYWKGMVKDYKYVAIGGIVTQEIKRTEHAIFERLISIASENGCKVHGLGYTNLQGLTKYKFYSVDSTTWLFGNRSGKIYKFTGQTMGTVPAPTGMELNSQIVAAHNFNEWVKFQRYAEKHL